MTYQHRYFCIKEIGEYMEMEKQKYAKFQWFTFVILIPVIFTTILVLVILSVAGFDIAGKSKDLLSEVPLVEKLFKKEPVEVIGEKPLEKQGSDDLEKQLEETIEEQAIMIKALEQDLTNRETEIQKLNQKINSLESELKDKESNEAGIKTKDITKLYENMSSKKAAEIIPKLKNEEAMLILTSLDDKQAADILSKMSVDDAVKFTNLLATDNQ